MVSAIVPIFNGGRFLAAAIDSIRAQNVADLEIIVVDDGSTDGTGDAARRIAPEARHIRQDNRGVAAARNRGIAVARGEFVAFLDHDDIWSAGRLQRQLECMRAEPDIGIVTGKVHVFGQPIPGRAWSNASDPESRESLLLGAALIRRAVFDAIGTLSEAVGIADDVEWLQRAHDLGVRTIVLDVVTLHYRWHDGNTSRDIDAVWDSAATAIKTRLDRRRRARTDPNEPPLGRP